MSVFATSTSPVITGIGVGTGASKYTDLVTQYVNTLASGSKASLDDQLNAWENLQSLIFSDAGGGNGGLLEQTNKNDWKRAADTYDNSDLTKRLMQVDGQFQGAISAAINPQDDMAQVGVKVAQSQLNALGRFSQDDQKIIFVAEEKNIHGAYIVGGKEIYYASLDDWKADLKKQAAAVVTQPPASDEAVASGTTAASINGSQSTTKPAVNAVAALLPKGGAPATDASVALQILLKFQDEMNTEKLAAAALATKTGTFGVPNYSASKAAATPQTTPKATSTLPADHLNQIA
jgi:hypothetical protein